MVAKKLLLGASSRLVITTVNIIVALLMTPFIIHSLGDELYGLWILVSVISSFYGVMDFGLSVATQREIAQSLAKQDTEGANVAVVTSFVMFCVVSLIIALVTVGIAAAAPLIVDDGRRVSDFRMTIAFLATSLIFLFPTYSVNGIYTANYRYELTSCVHLARVIVRSLLIYVGVSMGGGLLVLAAITTLTDVLAGVAMVVIAHRLAPWLKWHPSFFRANRLGAMLDFGGAYLFAALSERGRYSLPSFTMNATVGLSGVTLFGIAQQIYDYFVLFLANIFGVFQPLFIRQQSTNQDAANTQDFMFVTQLGLSAAVVMATGVVACSPDFIRTWLGVRYETAIEPLFVLVILGVFHSSLQANSQVLLAYARHRAWAVLTGAEVLASAALLWPLSKSLQMAGVAAALLAPAVFSRLFIQPLILRRSLRVDIGKYFISVLKAAGSLAIACWIIVEVREHIPGHGYLKVIAMGLAALVVAVPIVSLVCLDVQIRKRLISLLLGVVLRKRVVETTREADTQNTLEDV